MNGQYYASGRAVMKAPEETATGVKMGFRVCILSDGVDDDGAQEIADALNAAESKRQWDEAIAANREEHEA